MSETDLHYFKNSQEWRNWLHENHDKKSKIELIFYRVSSDTESMRWEEAVQVALCYGWIDSTVRKIDNEKRKQTFTPRKLKSVWSKLNKSYIEKLTSNNLMHESGLKIIEIGKQNGSWTSLDGVERLEIPNDLELAFTKNKMAYTNYQNFSFSYRKSYLYWLNQAKLEETRKKRIQEIILLCEKSIKSRM